MRVIGACEEALFEFEMWQLAHPGFEPAKHVPQGQEGFRPGDRLAFTAEMQEYLSKEGEVRKLSYNLTLLAQQCLPISPGAVISAYRCADAHTESCKQPLRTYAHVLLPAEHNEYLARFAAAYEVLKILQPVYREASPPRSHLMLLLMVRDDLPHTMLHNLIHSVRRKTKRRQPIKCTKASLTSLRVPTTVPFCRQACFYSMQTVQHRPWRRSSGTRGGNCVKKNVRNARLHWAN